MNKYQSYKPSGIEWIGEIPSSWDLGKLKHYFNLRSGKNPNDFDKESGQFPVYGSNGIIGYTNNPLLYKETILIGRVGSSGELNLNEFPCSVSDNCLIVEIKGDNNLKFVYYLLIKTNLKNYTTQTSQPLITGSTIKEIDTILPTPSEQLQIVKFLDEKTDLIDGLISIKERKISLLKEQRTSLINQVVTKGLNPNVKMKDSGLEWIGDIPNHWELKPLKYLIKNLNSGVSVNSDNVPVEDEIELGVLKTSCVYGDIFRPEENKKVVIEEISRVNCPVIGDSIIISRMNTPELVGSSGYVYKNYSNLFLPDRLWITEFKKDVNVSVKFYSYILKSDRYKKTLSSKSTGTSSSMKNISKNDLLSLPVPYFDLKEQIEISKYLDDLLKKSDNLIQLEQKKINLLKEYRQSLISEVVTGKIKVTN